MKTSIAGRKAISEREGVRLKAYRDLVGIWTIGVGHTSAAGPPAVYSGQTITAVECDEILSRDLAKFEAAVNGSVTVPLSQNQFDALVSLAFNIGGGAFAKSSLVRKLNGRDYAGASDAFLAWDKAGGQVVQGLSTRRQAERAQFLRRDAPNPPSAPPAPAVAVPALAPSSAAPAAPEPAPGFWARFSASLSKRLGG